MNRVMLNFTPDRKPFRKSIIGTTTTASASSSFSGSVSIRRRYSLAVDASISLSVNGTASEKQTPSCNGAVAAGRSLSQPVSGTPGAGNKRMSVHENLIMKILSTPVDQPLATDDSDSSSDVSFSSSLAEVETPLSAAEQLCESDVFLRCTTPPNALIGCQNPRLARLYKDLQSPSATTRIRALRALKSPSKREAYGQFDVPHEEQDIITAEERQTPQRKTIQEIMAGVCIYVEVRSGADNRTDGIKDHVASLGAKINEKLYKDTTHVIFKDGLLSTYQKAKKMNIPVASVLWIEACKRHMCLIDPGYYPISNLERYENPELFKKIRRQKSMQPGAETAVGSPRKRPPLNAANSKDNGSSKSVISPPTKLPVLHRLRKDDGLERILNEFQAENQNTPEPEDDIDKLLEGPMKLLERFRNSPVVAAVDKEKEKEEATPEVSRRSIRKSLFNGSAEKATPPGRTRRSTSASKENSSTVPESRHRRKTMLFTPRITSVEEENESPASITKPVRNRKKTMSVSAAKENTPPRESDTICSPKAMELCKANSADVQKNIPPPSSQKVRNTIYSPSRMEQSSEKTEKTAMVEVGPSSRRTLCLSTTGNVIDGSEPRKTKTPELDAKDLEAFRTNRRRTLYTPGVYDESDKQQKTTVETPVINRRRTVFNPAANSTAASNSTPANQSSAHRRRTLYTPSASVEIPETPDSTATNRRRTTVFTTPNPVPTPQKTLAAIATPSSAGLKRNKTLLEEYQSSLTFNSTRTPVSERRKTIFDISMDIIDQRLSQINRQSKQSVPPSDESKSKSAEAALKSPPPRPSSVVRQTSMDSFYRKQSRSTEKTIQFKNSADLRESTITSSPIISRKRKLFNAQPPIAETPPSSSNSQGSDPISLPENAAKRPKTVGAVTTPGPPKRRSLAPTPVAPKSASAVAVKTAAAASRRSSMFFSRPTVSKPVAGTARPVMGTQARTMKALGLGAGLPTAASQQVATQSKTARPPFQLTTTNLHAAQHAFVKEAVVKLGGFTLANNVTDRTTHLVSLEPRRTMNILRALARGLWIISYEWIEQSFAAARWLPEEQFELRDFSAAVQICRSERQAFGPRYRMELFADCGLFYVSEKCDVPHDQLRELIVTCRGKITGNALKARYVVVSSRTDLPAVQGGTFCVSPLWVLDSISINKVKKVYKYLVRN